MRNEELFLESKKVLVGGVNSPVRAIKPYPFFVSKGQGAKIFDEEGKSYVDYCLAFGPLILGHNNPIIRRTVEKRLNSGWCFGTPTSAELEYAKFITSHVPNVDKIRCVNTGTEATMTAIRLARGFTGRDKIIKIEGAFHGAHDCVLVKAGSGALTHSVPNSKGIPDDVTKNTILIPFNDVDSLEQALKENKDQVAALITEPVIGNAGCILPEQTYLNEIKKILSEHGSLLILDEVITGFRLGMGGAQEYFKVDADIITMGKIVGGGFPIGVMGARNEIMDMITPSGPVYNAGTFNGHPLSISAGLATLKMIKEKNILQRIAETGKNLQKGLSDIINDINLGYQVQGIGPMFQVYFNNKPVWNLDDAKASDADSFLKYCKSLREKGVYLPPSQFECCFVSTSHDNEILNFSLEQFEAALKEIMITR
ncbi:MAG: glutamate-1-semialdehyde 2,1-aminomutase [Thermoplasmatales archaeon]|nr:MAG: glutamate-1-semialdehyde 2,1-aminomutase [Thermoplasmatales archaeon]